MPKITVLQPLARLGGLDVLYHGLSRQTFQDYELILIDEWHDFRADIAREMAGKTGVKLTQHIKPDRRGLAHALNLGIEVAKGEVVCPLNDHHWPQPTWLERHWQVYQDTGKAYTCNGLGCHYRPPPMKPLGLPVEEYAYSLFKEPFSGKLGPLYYRESLAWRKSARMTLSSARGLYTSTGREYYNTLNNSIPLEVLKRLNGYDETYDQQRAYLDVDMGIRAEMLGHRFVLDTQNVMRILAHEFIDKDLGELWKPYFTWEQPQESNDEYMKRRIQAVEELLRAPNKGGEEK